jgi:hypothetical protein
MQVVPLTFKERMLFDMQNDIQIARRPTEPARLAEARETYPCTVLYSGRHFSLNHALAQQSPFAPALRARIRNHAPRSLARRTSPRNAEKSLLIPHLPTPSASLARRRSLPWRRSISAARIAGLVPTDIHLLVDAKHCLIKFQTQVFAEIRPTLSPAAPPPTLPKHVAKAKDVAENIAKVLEDSRIESRRTTAAPTEASMTKAVIQRSLVAIGKNRVRLRNLLKLIFRIRIIRIAVRMVRHRQLAIRALDLDVRSRTRNPEHFVIITFSVSRQKLPHSSGSCFEDSDTQPLKGRLSSEFAASLKRCPDTEQRLSVRHRVFQYETAFFSTI